MELERASVGALAARQKLAEALLSELTAVGLPTTIWDGYGTGEPGARIIVDLGADAAGGVFVEWQCSPRVEAEAEAALSAGAPSHTAIRRAGRMAEVMSEAIRALLVSAGFGAEMSVDDYRPYTVSVIVE